MNTNPTNTHTESPIGNAPRRDLDLPALVAMTWSVAAGLLTGGVTVATLVLTGRLSGHVLVAASAVFYIVGAVLGLAHGITLGILGRPEGVTPRQAFAGILHGMIYLLPALLLGWLLAGWVAALPIVLIGRHILGGAITLVAWMVTAAIVAVAAAAGFRAARLAFRRWPDRWLGTVLVATVAVALSVMFAIERPTVWFIGLHLTGFGAIAFVYLLTFWFYGPIITTGLVLMRRLAPALPASRIRMPSSWREWALTGSIVLVAGLTIVALAVPLHAGVLGLPTDTQRFGLWQGTLFAASRALTDEVLLRLFVFTAAFLVATRYFRRSPAAVAAAIAIAVVGDLLLHWPHMMAMGLPGVGALLSYMVTRMAIPAVVFGYLYYRRGLGTAVAVHAAADVTLGLLLI